MTQHSSVAVSLSRRLGVAALAVATVMGVTAFGGSALASSGKQLTVKRYAVILGSNNGGTGRSQLRYAGSDAKSFAQVLKSLGGLEENDMFLVEEADIGQIRSAFVGVATRLRLAKGNVGRTEVVVYYSGHSDEKGLLPNGKLLSYSELKKMVKELPADVRIVVLDSCASGALIRTKGGKKRPGFMVDASSQVKGQAIITSASADEEAQESDRIGASFFTHHLVAALRGAADADGDGKVTLNEAYKYTFHETLKRTQGTASGPQHPNYDINLAGTGDVVITSLRSYKSVMVLSSGIRGRVFVRDAATKRLVMELPKQGGRALKLGLAPGAYTLTLRRKDTVKRADVFVQGGRTVVSNKQFVIQVADAHRTRGGSSTAVAAEATLEERDPAYPPVVRKSRVSIQFMPTWGTRKARVRNFSFNIVAGRNWSVRGAELGMVNIVDVDVDAFQAGFWNHVGRHLDGFQWSALANHVGGNTAGAQLSTFTNHTAGDLAGAQLSALGNVLGGHGKGLQLAAVFNHTSGDFAGFQFGGLFNTAARVDGLQWSAMVNHADEIAGAQLGLINVAGKASGLMLGLINVSDDLDGEAIGLINVIDGGYQHFEVFSSDTHALSLGYKLGGKVLYSTFFLGMNPYATDTRLAMGFGIGAHAAFNDKLGLDVDLVGSFSFKTDQNTPSGIDPVVLTQLRIALGYQFFEHFGLYAGLTVNAAVTLDPGKFEMSLFDLGDVGREPVVGSTENTDGAVSVWPGFIVGVRL